MGDIAELPGLIDLLEATLGRLRPVLVAADDADWARSTGCPGWSVADNVSHLIGLERSFDGRPDPGCEHEPIEASVRLRRGRSKAELLAEYDEVTAERIANLRGEIVHPSFDPDRPVQSPMGRLPSLASLLRLRIFDVYAHAQDIRRALGVTGDLDSPAAAIAVRNILRGMTSLPLRLPAVAGTTVAVDVPGHGEQVVDFTGERAVVRPGPQDAPTVRLAVTLGNLLALGCGRSDAEPGAVVVEGDDDLGRAVVAALSVTP